MKEFFKCFMLLNVLIVLSFGMTFMLKIVEYYLGSIPAVVLTIWVVFGLSYVLYKILDSRL